MVGLPLFFRFLTGNTITRMPPYPLPEDSGGPRINFIQILCRIEVRT